MKIMVYEARPDERADLEKQAALHGVELSVTDAVPTLENASLAAGCIGVSILGQGCIDAALLDAYHALGIRYLSTRTIGYDHIDLDHARSIGLRVCSASYAPNGVADFTVMMILMCLRHYKQALWRGQVNDFSLTGLQGREMKDLTIGIIGIVVSICIQGIVSGWMDVLSIYICPLGAGLAAIMFFWFCKREFVEAEVNKGRDKPLFPWFYPLCKYVLCPVCVLVLILGALNGGIG